MLTTMRQSYLAGAAFAPEGAAGAAGGAAGDSLLGGGAAGGQGAGGGAGGAGGGAGGAAAGGAAGGGGTAAGGGGGGAAAAGGGAGGAGAGGAAAGGQTDAERQAAANKERQDAIDSALKVEKEKWAKDGWRESIQDPELKKTADRFTSVADIIKSNNELRTANAQRIKVPDEKSSAEDKAAFSKAIGVPEKVEEYQYATPDKTADGQAIAVTDEDKSLVEALIPVMHKAGAPKAVLKAMLDAGVEFNARLRDAAIAALEENRQTQVTALKKEWPGKEFDANMELAKRVGNQLGGPEFMEILNNTQVGKGPLGDHPAMIKVLAKLARQTAEGGIAIGAPNVEEQKSAQDEINRLNQEVPPGSPAYTSAVHQAKLKPLYERLAGGSNQPIVGQGNRTN